MEPAAATLGALAFGLIQGTVTFGGVGATVNSWATNEIIVQASGEGIIQVTDECSVSDNSATPFIVPNPSISQVSILQ